MRKQRGTRASRAKVAPSITRSLRLGPVCAPVGCLDSAHRSRSRRVWESPSCLPSRASHQRSRAEHFLKSPRKPNKTTAEHKSPRLRLSCRRRATSALTLLSSLLTLKSFRPHQAAQHFHVRRELLVQQPGSFARETRRVLYRDASRLDQSARLRLLRLSKQIAEIDSPD